MPKKPRFDLSPPRSRGGAAATVVVVVRLKPAKLETEPIPLALSLEVNPGGSIASVWPHPLLSLSLSRPPALFPTPHARSPAWRISLSLLSCTPREKGREKIAMVGNWGTPSSSFFAIPLSLLLSFTRYSRVTAMCLCVRERALGLTHFLAFHLFYIFLGLANEYASPFLRRGCTSTTASSSFA